MCVHVCRCICACVCTQTHILHTGVTILVLSVATNVLNEHELEQTLKESEGWEAWHAVVPGLQTI